MIITSFSRKGYDEYGREFIETFLKHWKDEPLTVYHEGLPSDAPRHGGITYIDLTQQQHFLQYARKLYEADPLYRGIAAHGKIDELGGKQVYDFRFDAFKFFRKVWALKHYTEQSQSEKLFAWFDADIVFKKDIPFGFLAKLLEPGKYLAYIGRGGGLHSECGAMVFDPTHPVHAEFWELYWRIYETGAFRRLDEFHDSFVFDFVRDVIQPPETNLGKGCDPMHPFVFTKLGLYMDHKKGPERKKMGYSPEAVGQDDLAVSNNGERQARKDISLMKPNHVKRYEWARDRLEDINYPGDTLDDKITPPWKPDVLDAACGVGYGSTVLAPMASEIVAVDRSENALAYAREHYAGSNIEYVQADLTQPEQLPPSDVIVSLETIEHVPDSGALVHAFAGKAPMLIGSVPNEAVIPFDKKTHPFHYRHFTKTELEQLLNGAGYKVTRWATQYDKVPGEVVEDRTDGMCLLFVAERAA